MGIRGSTPEELQEQWNDLRKQSEKYNNELTQILLMLQNMLKGTEENYYPLELTYADEVTEILRKEKPPSESEQRIVQEHFRHLTSNINSVATTLANKQVGIVLTPDEIALLGQANDHAKQLSALRKSSPDYKSRSTKIAELGHSINQQVSGALTSIGAAFVSLATKVKDSVKSYAMKHGSSSSSYSAGGWGGTEDWYPSPNAKQDNDSIFSGFGKLLTKAGSFFSSIKQSLSSSNPDTDAPFDLRYDDDDLYKDLSTGFDYGADVVDDPTDTQMPPQTFNEVEAEAQQGPQDEQQQPPQVEAEAVAPPQGEVQNFSLPTSEFKAELKALVGIVNKNLNYSEIDSESKQILENFAENLNFSRFQLENGSKSPAEIAQDVKWDLQNFKTLQDGLNVSPELKQKIDEVQRAVDNGLGIKRVTFSPDTKGP